MRQPRPSSLAISAWDRKCCPVRRKLLLAIVVCAATVPSSSALAASITLIPESDTYVRASDPTVAHGTETSFDVHGAASSYGCGTGPANGLLRFNLAGDPGRRDDHGRDPEADELDGIRIRRRPGSPRDLPRRRLLVGERGHVEHASGRRRRATGSAGRVALCTAFRSAPRRPSSARPPRSRRSGCSGTRADGPRTSARRTSAPASAAERAGDGKLSLEIFTIACGTPFSVVCQNGKLEQSYFLRYYSREDSVLNAPRLRRRLRPAAPLATPSLIRVVSTGGTGAFVIGRVDGASNLPLTLAASTAATCTAGALPGGGVPAAAPFR